MKGSFPSLFSFFLSMLLLFLSTFYLASSLSFLNILDKILIYDVLIIRIERLELFDEFEEWHMMQASRLLLSVVK